jgi:hypothetical protein
VHRKVPAGFGGRLRGKGPPQRDLAAQPILLRGIQGKYPTKVSLAEDQHRVSELGADGQDEAFGEAVRPRAAWWDLDHLEPMVAAAATRVVTLRDGRIVEPRASRATTQGQPAASLGSRRE